MRMKALEVVRGEFGGVRGEHEGFVLGLLREEPHVLFIWKYIKRSGSKERGCNF